MRRVVLLETDVDTLAKAMLLGAKTVLFPVASCPRRAIPSVVLAIPPKTETREVRLAALVESSINPCRGEKENEELTGERQGHW